MPFQRKYNTVNVLDRAMQAFWARGYEATSISDLVQATGMNRASLYGAFGDKRGLFVESLRHYDRVHREAFLERVADGNAPREAILAAFEGAARQNGSSAFPTGCLLVNTALEVSPHDPEVRALVNQSLAAVELFFQKMIKDGQADGTIHGSLNPSESAKILLGLFLGLRVMTRTQTDETVLEAVIQQARALLD